MKVKQINGIDILVSGDTENVQMQDIENMLKDGHIYGLVSTREGFANWKILKTKIIQIDVVNTKEKKINNKVEIDKDLTSYEINIHLNKAHESSFAINEIVNNFIKSLNEEGYFAQEPHLEHFEVSDIKKENMYCPNCGELVISEGKCLSCNYEGDTSNFIFNNSLMTCIEIDPEQASNGRVIAQKGDMTNISITKNEIIVFNRVAQIFKKYERVSDVLNFFRLATDIEVEAFENRTIQWEKFEKYGAYYGVLNEELYCAPINSDGGFYQEEVSLVDCWYADDMEETVREINNVFNSNFNYTYFGSDTDSKKQRIVVLREGEDDKSPNVISIDACAGDLVLNKAREIASFFYELVDVVCNYADPMDFAEAYEKEFAIKTGFSIYAFLDSNDCISIDYQVNFIKALELLGYDVQNLESCEFIL